MKSETIEELLEYRNFLISVEEYVNILRTSPQIKDLHFDEKEKDFFIETDDQYKFKFKINAKK